jgi:hypothetical protein
MKVSSVLIRMIVSIINFLNIHSRSLNFGSNPVWELRVSKSLSMVSKIILKGRSSKRFKAGGDSQGGPSQDEGCLLA